MIEKINNLLKEIKSNFRTDDGINLVWITCNDMGTFRGLRKSFNNQDECYNYLIQLKNNINDRMGGPTV